MGRIRHTHGAFSRNPLSFAYDPEAIIFGGGITTAFPLFESAMHQAMKEFPYPKSMEKLQIRISTNPDIAILGAAGLVEE